MPVTSVHIETFIALSAQMAILDVRSPAEYDHAHFPGAHSLPLFNNEERRTIGTAYKQVSREDAVNLGLDFFSSRMKELKGKADGVVDSNQPKTKFLVYCWRGGMRSGAVAWLLSLYGYEVFVLQGGYKTFRRFVLKQFEKARTFQLLGGFTGSGKTNILRAMKNRGQSVIDLEGLAKHRGSAFGALGMPVQPTQEMFENELALQLLACGNQTVWVEDESRHIGRVHIPAAIWEQMRQSTLLFLDVPLHQRLQSIVNDYGVYEPAHIEENILRIQKRLGGLATRESISRLKNGDLAGCFEILLAYYDRCYLNSLQSRKREGIEVQELSYSGTNVNVDLIMEKQNYE